MEKTIVNRLLCAVLLMAAIAVPLCAQPDKDVGNFDISKVQEAIAAESYAPGGDSASPRLAGDRREESLLAIVSRIVGYLILVIFLIIAVLWVLRKTGMIGASRIGGGSMDVLEALSLGQGKNVVLVRVMDKVFVLAQSSQNVTVIDKIEGEKAIEVIASAKGESTIVPFKEMVNSFLGKMKKQ